MVLSPLLMIVCRFILSHSSSFYYKASSYQAVKGSIEAVTESHKPEQCRKVQRGAYRQPVPQAEAAVSSLCTESRSTNCEASILPVFLICSTET